MNKLIDHHFAYQNAPIPPVIASQQFDYLVGSNGVFVRSRRDGLEVCMPVAVTLADVVGLHQVYPYAQWGFPKVPVESLDLMTAISRGAWATNRIEVLFYLLFNEGLDCRLDPEHISCGRGWHTVFPAQDATHESVTPKDPESRVVGDAVIELHSHHEMAAEFSETDNLEESKGFRVYAVLGTLFTEPTINVRVGLFGYFMRYPASEFFEVPQYLTDANICRGENASQ